MIDFAWQVAGRDCRFGAVTLLFRPLAISHVVFGRWSGYLQGIAFSSSNHYIWFPVLKETQRIVIIRYSMLNM
jgi:hypothetical protein